MKDESRLEIAIKIDNAFAESNSIDEFNCRLRLIYQNQQIMDFEEFKNLVGYNYPYQFI